MLAMARGDRAALARLILLYGRGVRIFAGHQLGDPAEAEDIAQEVFLRVWARAASYDPAKAAVSTWIYRIASNLCTDRRRRRSVRRFLGLERAPEDLHAADDAPSADRVVAGRQTLRKLRKALADLPERQREALLLKTVGGLDTAAIAKTLGTSTGAAEQLLVRARSALRRELGEP